MTKKTLREYLKVLWEYVGASREFDDSLDWRTDKKLWKRVVDSDKGFWKIKPLLEKYFMKSVKKPVVPSSMMPKGKMGKKGKIKAGKPC